jgi:hypothetical protein
MSGNARKRPILSAPHAPGKNEPTARPSSPTSETISPRHLSPLRVCLRALRAIAVRLPQCSRMFPFVPPRTREKTNPPATPSPYLPLSLSPCLPPPPRHKAPQNARKCPIPPGTRAPEKTNLYEQAVVKPGCRHWRGSGTGSTRDLSHTSIRPHRLCGGRIAAARPRRGSCHMVRRRPPVPPARSPGAVGTPRHAPFASVRCLRGPAH